MKLEEYARCDGLQLAALVRRGEVKVGEVVACALAAIERINPAINAVIGRLDDKAIEAQVAALPAEAPFRGVPFLIKDLVLHMAGVRCDMGSRLIDGAYVPPADSDLMARFRRSGVITLGIFACLTVFTIKFRRRPGNEVARQIGGNIKLELTWTAIPLCLAMIPFVWGARLYFDMSLNVFYVLSGLWGWWAWTYGGAGRTEKPIGNVTALEAMAVLAAGAALTALMWHGGILLESAAPVLDAITTGISVVAQWLLMRRFLENWYAWIVADIVYVPMYFSRGLPLTAVLYAIFLLMCLRGLVEWRAIMRRQRAERTAAVPALAASEAGA